MRLQLTQKVSIALLTITAATNAISLFFLSSLNTIIHGTLYNYGLNFNLGWAVPQWSYNGIATSCVVASALLAAFSILLLFLSAAKRIERGAHLIPITMMMEAALGIIAIYALTRIDSIVNADFYNFGLQPDLGWLEPYWLYLRSSLVLTVFSVFSSSISAALTFTLLKPKISSKAASAALLGAGSLLIAFSVYQNSTVAAFTGLGLILWGIVLGYVTVQEYVKKELLAFSTLSNYAVIERILKDFGSAQRAIYLPAKYSNSLEANYAFLMRSNKDKLPSPESLLVEEKLGVGFEKGKLLVPPGHGLTKLLEKALRTSFTQVDLKFLNQNLPKLVTEELEIVSEFNTEIHNDSVQVKFRNSVFDNDAIDEDERYSLALTLLGCPLTSALACALAKASGKPTIIAEYHKIKSQRITTVTYKFLDEI